jgi:hypothetical protein
MAKSYIAISAIIFALVAIGHVVRIAQGWQVQLGDVAVAMAVSWVALVPVGCQLSACARAVARAKRQAAGERWGEGGPECQRRSDIASAGRSDIASVLNA